MSSAAHSNDHHGANTEHMAAGFAAHLDLEAVMSAPMTEEALNAGAAALDAGPTRIVDLGAGTGAGTLALARRFPGAQVDSLDISAELLAALEASVASAGVADRVTAHLVDLDGDWSGVVPARADLLWASMSLHHLRDAPSVLRRAFAALRPGGVLVVTEMAGGSSYEPHDLNSGTAGLADRVASAFTAAGRPATADWSRAIEEAGFGPVHRHDHTVAISGGTTNGARYLLEQFHTLRDRLTSDLSPTDVTGLDGVIADLEAGTSTIVQSSDRVVWVAVRPSDTTTSAQDAHEIAEEDKGMSAARPRKDTTTIDADVVVVGGGVAGLAASVVLARSRRRVVVIDAGRPRNAVAHGAHNVLGNEGISPLELLSRGRAEAEAYGVQILDGRATGASGKIDDFTIEVESGLNRVHARRVILAGGLIDDLPDVPGVREGWGSSVLHCPFCHGWEVRDQRIGILAREEVAVHHAMLFRRLSDNVTVFLHEAAEPTQEQWDQLAALDVRVVHPRVDRLILDGHQVRGVQIDGGRRFELDAVVVAPMFNVRTELFEALGGAATPTPFGVQIQADANGGTAVPGVFTAGNAGQPMAMLVAATASGVTTGSAVHGSLAFADLTVAVERRRAPFPAASETTSTTNPGNRLHGS